MASQSGKRRKSALPSSRRPGRKPAAPAPARAAKAGKPAKAARPAKAAKAGEAAGTAKAARPNKATKATRPAEAAKSAKPAKPAKAGKPAAAAAARGADDAASETGVPFPIVGIGASAGGLEACSELLKALPVDTGMAFVVVQHLAPARHSLLAEILSRTTAMPVSEVADQQRVEPNRIYVTPPDRTMSLSRGTLQLFHRRATRDPHRPIDVFFRALAAEQKHLAIGVILSGTATDGTLGFEEIKAAGGITFAQDDTAQQTSMPRSAIASGCVDFVLSADEIAREIGRIARHPYVALAAPANQLERMDEADLREVLEPVRNATGVDFSQYKASTLFRRIARRMVLHRLEGFRDYARLLARDRAEVKALFQDILINVTSFFRNPETFAALREKILPRLYERRRANEPLRLWVLACSTGEEAYSLAITVAEFAEARGHQVQAQILASDLNTAGLEKARAGVYSRTIAHDVPPELLRRYFTEVDGGYRIHKSIRDLCVFARHNVLVDPPFSQIDLVSCRNLLIYLQPELQKQLVPLLHYALKPDGFLLLGSSETIGSYRELFEPDPAGNKIYVKKKAALHKVSFGLAAFQDRERTDGVRRAARVESTRAMAEAQKEADRVLMARFVPPGVLVAANLEILQFRGNTGLYLAPAPGKASLNLLRMAREGLLVKLRAAIQQARKEQAPIREEGVRVKADGAIREVDLEVIPLTAGAAEGPDGEGGFLVLFEEPAPKPASPARGRTGRREAPPPAASPETPAAGSEAIARENVHLAQELAATRDYLQSVIEQEETANEELQAANEETQSANEELQSINEELETSKEELQSSNEELRTVNEELQNRNLELTQAHNDLLNLLASVEMPIVMLGLDLRVRRYTPPAEKYFNLIPSDVGRPVGDIKLKLNVSDLDVMVEEALATPSVKESEVQDREGAWHLLRIRPYRTAENKIDGAVIVLVDVDALKRLEESLRQRVQDLATADRTKNEFLALLAHELRNPLAPLRNALQVLETPGADLGDAERARKMMVRQVRNMSRMIDDLLDVSRITEGKIRLRQLPVELAALLEGTVEQVRETVDSRGQALTLSLPRKKVVFIADATRLEQVFGNLLSNASKFTPNGGHLWVTAELDGGAQDGSEIVVRVRDDGIGIGPETLPHVFDLFLQADRSLDRARGGLGIGLTLVRRLVELHGGSVEAASAGPGGGSEFTVRLPLSLPAAEREGHDEPASVASARPAGLAAAAQPAQPRRVLVVDDNADAAESLALLLRLRGHTVEVAGDGRAALRQAAAFLPEVVLLDIGLPGLDGYQVASLLRQRRPTASALLVAVTGYAQEEDQRRARQAGFDHHLVKPVDPQLIYNLLDDSRIGSRGTRRARAAPAAAADGPGRADPA